MASVVDSLVMTERHQIIGRNVTHLLAEADILAREMGRLNQFSVRGLAGAQVGKLGELVAYEYMREGNVEFRVVDCTEYDAIFKHLGREFTLEIKTKERRVEPREDYECSAFAYNQDHQKPDFYLFISLLSDKTKGKEDINRFTYAYILGTMSGTEFDLHARDLSTSYLDPTNNWSPSKDTRNVFIRDLAAPKLSV